jgi:hypothetical protein
VWRTDDSGGAESQLTSNCNAAHLDPGRPPCGDWAPLGPKLTEGFALPGVPARDGNYIVATTRAPGDDGTLWAGTRVGRVFVSSNADADASAVQFSRIDGASTPGRFVSGIAVDPSDPNHAWVSFSGYGAYTPESAGHVFEVHFDPATHGSAWTDVSGNIGDQPVTSVAENGENGDLYAGTDFGVLRRPNGSSVWEEAAPGLPRVAVYGLSLSQSGHVLYAATHGRSAYSIRLPSRPTVSISGPAELRVGDAVTYAASGVAFDGGAVTFAWQLPGDPPTGSGASVSFTPTTPGQATVRVTATDAGGLARTAERQVTISPAAGGSAPDTAKPTLTLKKVKRVRRPKRSTIKGRATDASGIRRVTVRFGDGRRRRATLSRTGRFTVKHRYKRAATFEATVIAVDKAGNTRTRHAKVRVLKKR